MAKPLVAKTHMSLLKYKPLLLTTRECLSTLIVYPKRLHCCFLYLHKTNTTAVAFQEGMNVNEQRLPHGIKVSFIRFCQNWINTSNHEHFTYKGIPIPITSAVIGEFTVDEVRLD